MFISLTNLNINISIKIISLRNLNINININFFHNISKYNLINFFEIYFL